jgi:hypothetical protein
MRPAISNERARRLTTDTLQHPPAKHALLHNPTMASDQRNEKQARKRACLISSVQPGSAAMPMAVPAAMVMPAHLRGHRLRIVLDHRGGAGIAQRHCLRALSRSSQNEQCADCGKSQNFRHVHVFFSVGVNWFTSAPRGFNRIKPRRRNASARVSDVNAK